MERRTFVGAAVLSAGAAFSGSLWRGAAAGSSQLVGSARLAGPAQPGAGPYGPVGAPDAHGLQLPQGFTSRVVARSRQTVAGSSYKWHDAPDGGACFAADSGGGWIYISNSELDTGGGAGAVAFGSDGAIIDAYRILANTRRNCAGGATPWGTWLSCEEVDRGFVFETQPQGDGAAVRRAALGRFRHEAAAADPVRRCIYLTEDEPDGCFYRFVPNSGGDLGSGRLEVLRGGAGTSGPVSWAPVPDRDGSLTLTRRQVSGAKKFDGGEGCVYADDKVWFTAKGDNRVWQVDLTANTIALVYDDSLVIGAAPLFGVDNLQRAVSGDLYVAEDGGNMEMCVITPEGVVATFVRITGQSGSEVTGPAFSPDGARLYLSSQRGTSGESSGGITYEVRGPFRV